MGGKKELTITSHINEPEEKITLTKKSCIICTPHSQPIPLSLTSFLFNEPSQQAPASEALHLLFSLLGPLPAPLHPKGSWLSSSLP